MTQPLSPAERAALAARGWYEAQQRRGVKNLDAPSLLLYQQLDAIYADSEPKMIQPRLLSYKAPLAERVCGHGTQTFYNLAVGYCRHADGSECDDLMGDGR